MASLPSPTTALFESSLGAIISHFNINMDQPERCGMDFTSGTGSQEIITAKAIHLFKSSNGTSFNELYDNQNVRFYFLSYALVSTARSWVS